MDKSYYIKLTLALYRVTELFPEKEPLRIKTREKADDLLADLILSSEGNPDIYPTRPDRNQRFAKGLKNEILNGVKIIDSFLELAEAQNWVDSRNLLVLRKGYAEIDKDISKMVQESEEIQTQEIPQELQKQDKIAVGIDKSEGLGAGLNERQKKIVKILKTKERVQVWEMKKVFPEVTKRTLRRDFEQLLNQRLIKRTGERNNTFYSLKN